MRISGTALRSRVGRRIVLLFVSCALLPIVILAVVAYHEVASQMRQESAKLLKKVAKEQGMEVYQRLEMLDADLQLVATEFAQRGALRTLLIKNERMQGLAVYSGSGQRLAQWGKAPDLVPLSLAEKRHGRAGNLLVKEIDCANGRKCLSLARAVAQPEGALVVATPDPLHIWAPTNVPPEFQFCVLASSQAALFCSDDAMYSSVGRHPRVDAGPGASTGRRAEDTADEVARWSLLLRPQFLCPSWTIVVSRVQADALAPLLQFRASFLLVIALSLWIVLLLSLVQIRRTLGPLEKLQEATLQVGARQFNSRVDVHSGDEFEDLAASFNAMTLHISRQFQVLEAIHEIDQAMFATLDREQIADAVLVRMGRLISSDHVGVCLFDDASSALWTRFRHVRSGTVTMESGIRVAQPFEDASCDGPFILSAGQRIPDYLFPLRQIRFRSALVLPIRVEQSVQGVLVCAHREIELSMIGEMHEAQQVADQLAVALTHLRLVKALEEQQWGILTALARAIDAKSQWTAGHSERVTDVAIRIGQELRLSSRELQVIHMGGLLHDIGKIGTPAAILDKPGKLTRDEMEVMQQHVSTGRRILEPIPCFREALPIVYEHHEWFNGGGYPQGLAGRAISLHARIFAVADCYDALISDRPYRKGLPQEEVLRMFREKSGEQFDPEVVNVFIRMMAEGQPARTKEAYAEQTR